MQLGEADGRTSPWGTRLQVCLHLLSMRDRHLLAPLRKYSWHGILHSHWFSWHLAQHESKGADSKKMKQLMNEPVISTIVLLGSEVKLHHKKAADILFLHVSQVSHMLCHELSIFLPSGSLARIYQGEQLMNTKQDKDLIQKTSKEPVVSQNQYL